VLAELVHLADLLIIVASTGRAAKPACEQATMTPAARSCVVSSRLGPFVTRAVTHRRLEP